MNYYQVIVRQSGKDNWEPLVGFDKGDPDQVVWSASERLTHDEAVARFQQLTKDYPEREFKVEEKS